MIDEKRVKELQVKYPVADSVISELVHLAKKVRPNKLTVLILWNKKDER